MDHARRIGRLLAVGSPGPADAAPGRLRCALLMLELIEASSAKKVIACTPITRNTVGLIGAKSSSRSMTA